MPTNQASCSSKYDEEGAPAARNAGLRSPTTFDLADDPGLTRDTQVDGIPRSFFAERIAGLTPLAPMGIAGLIPLAPIGIAGFGLPLSLDLSGASPIDENRGCIFVAGSDRIVGIPAFGTVGGVPM